MHKQARVCMRQRRNAWGRVGADGTESACVGLTRTSVLCLMTLVFGRLCTDGWLGCSWVLSNDVLHSRFAGLRGLRPRHFFSMTLVLGCLCTDGCLGCSSAYWWPMWGRQGLPKTPFPLAFGMVWTARDSQRHPFRIAFSAPWCAPALQSHRKAYAYGASLGAVWACLGVWLPYGTMAKKTHVEALWWFFGPAWVRRPSCYSHDKADPCGASLRPLWACLHVWACLARAMASQAHVEGLWWFFGPAWVRGPSCYSHDKADPCGASLRPLWACLRVWACLAKAMASQAHVEPLWWLCWPAAQTTRKQMSSPGTHQYTNTQGPVSLKKISGPKAP